MRLRRPSIIHYPKGRLFARRRVDDQDPGTSISGRSRAVQTFALATLPAITALVTLLYPVTAKPIGTGVAVFTLIYALRHY